ncbi:MAG: alpha/beta fold hydrolase [Candidatus Taylorbacteria bacterium]|nr:alpha/beta fold hydrolase [Candidatus Taylorbacteria bacterium]
MNRLKIVFQILIIAFGIFPLNVSAEVASDSSGIPAGTARDPMGQTTPTVIPTILPTATPVPFSTATPVIKRTPIPTSSSTPALISPDVQASPVSGVSPEDADGFSEVAVIVALGLGAVAWGAYVIRAKIKKSQEEKPDRCGNFRELLEQKKKELQEMTQGWPEKKVKEVARDRITNKLKQNKNLAKVLNISESMMEKYDKLNTAIELLQKKYDLCMLQVSSITSIKKVYIIHGWDGSPDEPMLQWLKFNLEKEGHEVVVPAMPEPDVPKVDAWLAKLREVIGLDSDTILVGHSMGCQAILRYLESFPKPLKIKGVVFIAPWIELDTETIKEEGEEVVELARPWLETPIDFEKIRTHIRQAVAIFSDDDPFVPLSNRKLFEKELGAKTFVEHEKGHFSPADNISELPVALEEIQKMAN